VYGEVDLWESVQCYGPAKTALANIIIVAIDSFTFCVLSSPKTLLGLKFLCSICIHNTLDWLDYTMILCMPNTRLHLLFSSTLYALYLLPVLLNLRYLNHFTFIPWKLIHFNQLYKVQAFCMYSCIVFCNLVILHVKTIHFFPSLVTVKVFYCHRQNLVTFYCLDFSCLLLFPYKDPFQFRTLSSTFLFLYLFFTRQPVDKENILV